MFLGRTQKIQEIMNSYTIQQDSLVKTFQGLKYSLSQNHQQLDFPSSQEASSSM